MCRDPPPDLAVCAPIEPTMLAHSYLESAKANLESYHVTFCRRGIELLDPQNMAIGSVMPELMGEATHNCHAAIIPGLTAKCWHARADAVNGFKHRARPFGRTLPDILCQLRNVGAHFDQSMCVYSMADFVETETLAVFRAILDLASRSIVVESKRAGFAAFKAGPAPAALQRDGTPGLRNHPSSEFGTFCANHGNALCICAGRRFRTGSRRRCVHEAACRLCRQHSRP